MVAHGSDRSPLRTQAQGRVLRALLRHGPVSQQTLAHRTRLNQATVSRVLAELKRHGLAAETETRAATPGRGRRPSIVDLDRRRAAVLGIQLGLRQAHIGLVDLRGDLIAETVVGLGRDLAGGLEPVIARGHELADRSLPGGSRLLGVGVGGAGVVDPEAGTVRFGLAAADPTLPVRGLLERAYGVPAFLSGNVHAMALAEAWFGVGPEVKSVALLYVARVIRLALVTEGRVYHGSGLLDGMLGHAVLDPEGPPCPCGQRGCLEVLASDARLESEALRLGRMRPESGLGRRLAADGGDVIGAIADAARAGDSDAAGLLRGRAGWLARAIVLVHHVLAPSRLLIAGTARLVTPEQLGPIQHQVTRLAPRLAGAVGVTSSTLPFPEIAVVGAATLVLEAFFAQDGRWAAAQERAEDGAPSADGGPRAQTA